MMNIYLDESGDLGFDYINKKPSEKFVITLLVCHNTEAVSSLKTAVRRTLKNKLNHKKQNRRVIEELHATSLCYPIKQYFYRHIKNQDWSIYAVVLNKRRVGQHLTSVAGRKKLYNHLSNFLMEQVDLSALRTTLTLVIDKCKNKEDISDFNHYLTSQIEARLPLNTPLNIYHEDSKANTGLQAVDLFCWGIFRKYEHIDMEWYSDFESQISFETEYFGE